MHLLSGHWLVWRVLLATIQDKGRCPCPHYLIPKSNLYRTGFLKDLAVRFSLARTYLVDKVKLAQQAIYMLGQPLKGTTAETILKDESLVPTLVRILFGSRGNFTSPSELFLRATITLRIQIIPDSSCRLAPQVQAQSSQVSSQTSVLDDLCCRSTWDRPTQRTVCSRSFWKCSYWWLLW